jgi:hypothetical protein
MTISIIRVPGSLMVQRELPYENVIFNDQEGVLYNPNTDVDLEQDAYFYFTCAPPVQFNFAWNKIGINWTRNYTATPTIFEALFTIEGILLDGSVHLLGEKLVDTITGSPVTEDVTFELRTSRSTPTLSRVGINTATAGKVQLNLPMRAINFEDSSLEKVWIDGWSKRKPIPVTGSSTLELSAPVMRPVIVLYDSDMNADFSDIRFCDKDGQSFLCYDLEYYSASDFAVFNVLLPDVGVGENRTIYMYYGNSTATYQGNAWNVFDSPAYYDDFEDGLYTGRSSPYVDWSVGTGTIAIESSTPISGSYSLKHTGSGSDSSDNIVYKTITATPNVVSFKFNLKTQGSGANTPYIFLWFLSFYNSSNYLRLDTYYNSGDNKQKLRLIRSGTPISTVDWLTGKLSTSDEYVFTLINTGTNLKVYVDGVLLINTAYSTVTSANREGIGANMDSAGLWDEIKISPLPDLTMGAIGSEEDPATISPDTYTEDDIEILFTLPADHSDKSPYFLESTELHHSSYNTNNVPVTSQDVLALSYNNADIYQAIKLGVYLKADKNCNIRFNSPLSYAYEVI